MKRLIGIIITVQVVLTFLILNALNDVSSSIKQAAVRLKSGDITMSWSNNLSITSYIILLAIGSIGVYLALVKEKNK